MSSGLILLETLTGKRAGIGRRGVGACKAIDEPINNLALQLALALTTAPAPNHCGVTSAGTALTYST
jgi:hypothetical protein